MLNTRSRQFRKLQAHWYKRLKDEGFNEIETVSTTSDCLKIYHSHLFTREWIILKQESQTEEFYIMAAEFYLEHRFNSEIERQIFRHFSEGLSLRKIAQALNQEGIKINKDTVNKHLKPLIKQMKRGY